MAPLRIIFMGTAELSCASLEKIASDKHFSVVAVVTQPDKPKGRQCFNRPRRAMKNSSLNCAN